MKKTYKNIQMIEMREKLQPLLSHKDKIGYVAARNFRIISNSLTEYETMRRELIEKYGEQTIDENGNASITIKIGTEGFDEFIKGMEPFNNIEHEVELMSMKYDEIVGCLTGTEILGIEWMLED